MTERPTIDDALGGRLRAGFQALESEVAASPAPPLTDARPPSAGTGRRSRLLVAAAVLAMVAVGGIVVWQVADDPAGERVATSPTDPSTTAAGDVEDLPLEGTRWWLVTAEDGGQVVDLGDHEPIGLQLRRDVPCESLGGEPGCEDHPVLFADDGCNGIPRIYRVEGDRIVLGRQAGPTTLMACSDPLIDLLGWVYGPDLSDVHASTEVTFEIRGDALIIRNGTAELVYRASSGPFAPTAGVVVDEGEVGSRSYRLTWDGGGLTLQDADTDEGIGGGETGVGEDPGRINAMRDEVGGRAYVLAIVPIETARAVYEPVGGTPVELPLVDVDSDTSAVIGAFVDEAPASWHLVAYDSDGVELDRLRWGG